MALALLLPDLAAPDRAMKTLDRYLPWECAGGHAFYVTLPHLLSKHFSYFHWHLPFYFKDTEAKQERKTSTQIAHLLQEKFFISGFTDNWDIEGRLTDS